MKECLALNTSKLLQLSGGTHDSQKLYVETAAKLEELNRALVVERRAICKTLQLRHIIIISRSGHHEYTTRCAVSLTSELKLKHSLPVTCHVWLCFGPGFWSRLTRLPENSVQP